MKKVCFLNCTRKIMASKKQKNNPPRSDLNYNHTTSDCEDGFWCYRFGLTHRTWCSLHNLPACPRWCSPCDSRMKVCVGGVQLPAGVQENEAQRGTECPTESTPPQPESSSVASLFFPSHLQSLFLFLVLQCIFETYSRQQSGGIGTDRLTCAGKLQKWMSAEVLIMIKLEGVR